MRFLRKRRLRVALKTGSSLIAAALVVGVFGLTARADEPSPRPGTIATSVTPAFKPARPYWLELTVAQREALAPLADDWERLDFQTKKKWVEIGNRYPRMTPEEQTRTRERMREWAMLTPEQRRIARDSFARIKAMPPEQRAEMLRKYQELPPEKRQALASEGHAAKPLVMPKTMSAPTPRRTQIREGAKVRNPVVAAQQSASPVVGRPAPKPAPVTPSAEPPIPLQAPAPAPVAPSP